MPNMRAELVTTSKPLPAKAPLRTAGAGVDISVIIPTFRRPEGLQRAMTSVQTQTGLGDLRLEIIICDNSPEGSAAAQCADQSLALTGKKPALTYLHEPAPGVANARNRALSAVSGTYLAFLDDDEEAAPDWLAELLKTREHTQADIVFGAIGARLSVQRGWLDPYLTHFFSRFGPDSDQVITDFYGCGNSLIRTDLIRNWPAPFETTRNETGGEDDVFFTMLAAKGARMAWSVRGFVHEDVPECRAGLSYTLKRAYIYGQGPAKQAIRATPPQYGCAAYWMIQGLAQAALMGLIAAGLMFIRPQRAPFALDKAARGLGKFFWFHRIGLYGQALLRRLDRQARARRHD